MRNRRLLSAAEHGRLEAVRRLLRPAWGGWLKAADPNTRDRDDRDCQTPLHKAAAEGHLMVAMVLVANGADVDARAKSLYTPLQLG